MTDELHSGLHLHLFVYMRTNVRQPQKYSLPLSILNRIVLLSQGLCPRTPTNFCVQKFDKKLYFLSAILSLRRSRTVSSFKLASLRRRRTVRGFNPPPRAEADIFYLTQARNSVQAQLGNVLLFAKTGLVFIAPENVASFHSPTSECVNTSDCRVLKVQLSA